MRKRVAILGSTGSIGQSALDVIEENPDKFQVVGLAARRNMESLAAQVRHFRPLLVSLYEEERACGLRSMVDGTGVRVESGMEGLISVATLPEAELVLSAIGGAAGLLPTISGVEMGKDVALANKEVLVMAGELLMVAARGRSRIIPVDSEHSAVDQALDGRDRSEVSRLILTASGGPFRGLSEADLSQVTPEAALRHPRWKMGEKVTVDSATLMNKGLEVIEAHWLFGIEAGRIEVLIHPQSIVHAMVEFKDGSLLAQLSVPDMRLPIARALAYPERLETVVPRLDLAEVKTLTFERPDIGRFPCLHCAYEALEAGGTMPAVLNAANEVAVEAFLSRRTSFANISCVIRETMDAHVSRKVSCLDEVLTADAWARGYTRAALAKRHGEKV